MDLWPCKQHHCSEGAGHHGSQALPWGRQNAHLQKNRHLPQLIESLIGAGAFAAQAVDFITHTAQHFQLSLETSRRAEDSLQTEQPRQQHVHLDSGQPNGSRKVKDDWYTDIVSMLFNASIVPEDQW